MSGSLTKSKEDSASYENEKNIDELHLEKIGKLVEDMESYLRSYIEAIYIGKTRETIFTIRS